MYRDVKKKLLSVALCICMIIGMVQVVPRAKAAADDTGRYTKNITGSVEGAGNKDFRITYQGASFTYDGTEKKPTLVSVEIIDGSQTIEVKDKCELSSGGTDAGTYSCYLVGKPGSGYTFAQNESTAITYTINKAKISDITVNYDKDVTLKYDSKGVTPNVSSVVVKLNDGNGTRLTLTDQYTVAPLTKIGLEQDCKVSINGKNFDDAGKMETTIQCDVAYDLAAGSPYYIGFEDGGRTDYTGSQIYPKLNVYATGGSKLTAVDTNLFTVKYNGSVDAQILAAGTYTVEVTPKSGASRYCKYSDAAIFTGTYTGTYTVGEKLASSLIVYCDNPDGTKRLNLTGGDELTLPYNNGNSVEPQNIVVQEAGGNTIPCTIEFENSRQAGTAYMHITPKAGTNYTGTIDIPYFIVSSIKITTIGFTSYNPNVTDLIYSGDVQLPAVVKVTNASGTELTKGETWHYVITYNYQDEYGNYQAEELSETDAQTNLGMASSGTKRIRISGRGKYTGQNYDLEYTIAPVSIASHPDWFALSLDKNSFYYDGTAKKPKVTFTYKTTHEIPADEYNVEYANNVNVGTASVTVTANSNSNYVGSMSINFSIKAVHIGNAVITDEPFTYNRSAVNPTIVIRNESAYGADYSYELKKGVDYEITGYTDKDGNSLDQAPVDANKDDPADKYHVLIKNLNTNNISGATKNLEFRIERADINTVTGFQLQGVNGDNREIEWNGGETKPALIGSALEPQKDYTFEHKNCSTVSIATGSALVEITGVGNYKGTKIISYTITPRSFVSGENSDFTFTTSRSGDIGVGYNIALTVKDSARTPESAKTLHLGADYTVRSVEYYDDLSGEWEALTVSVDYNVNEAEGKITSLKKAGKYRITIAGTGSYTGTLQAEQACGTDISNHYVHIDDTITSHVYNGNVITPAAFSLYNADGNKTSIGADCFTVDYERTDNYAQKLVDVGRIYVIGVGVPEKGYYGRTSRSDKTKRYYTITSPQWTGDELKIEVITSGGIKFQPNGGTPIPQIKVTFASQPLVENEDYELGYDENGLEGLQTAGSKVIYVNGINNYDSSTNKNWQAKYVVEKANINDADLEGGEANYNGGRPDFKLHYWSYELQEGVDYTKTIKYGVNGEEIVKYIEDGKTKYKVTYIVTGKGNFTDKREIPIEINVSSLADSDAVFADSAETAQVGQYYVVWQEDDCVISSEQAGKKESERTAVTPSAFDIVYKKSETATYTLKRGVDKNDANADYYITGYGTNVKPGESDNNFVQIEGINGYSGVRQLKFKLYTDISSAQTTSTSLIQSSSSVITKKKWLEVYEQDGERGLVELANLSFDESTGIINTDEYDLRWSKGFNLADPAVGTYVLTVVGNQSATHYYSKSFDISFTIVNGLEGATFTLNGESNAIRYDGTPAVVTGAGTSFVVEVEGVTLNRGTDYEILGYQNNDRIGEATVTIQGLGNYAGTAEHKFKVTYPLDQLVVYMETEDGRFVNTAEEQVKYKYKAKEIKPQIRVYCPLDLPSGQTDYSVLTPIASTSYTVDWENNRNAGTASVVIKDALYFTGDTRRQVPFTISLASICPPTKGAISYTTTMGTGVDNIRVTYSGKSFSADDLGIQLSDKGETLVSGNSGDYVIYYTGDTTNVTKSPALPVITFVGVNNYTDSHAITFSIEQKSLRDADITADLIELTYSGNPIESAVIDRMNIVHTGARKLVYGTDFEIEGYYTDSLCRIPVIDSEANPVAPSVQGTYYVRVKGIGNYCDEKIVQVDVGKKDMSNGLNITFVRSDECPLDTSGEPICTYNGLEHQPKVVVTYGKDFVLTEGSDYSISYSNNLNASDGTTLASVTVTALDTGNYEGSVSRTFVIKPKNIAKQDSDDNTMYYSSLQEVYTFTGHSVSPVVTIRDSETGDTLVDSADYTVEYVSEYKALELTDGAEPNSYAGQVTMTIKGQGNYTGTQEFTYYIGEDISQSYTLVNGRNSVSVDYNGLVQAPDENDITVVWGASSDLTDANGEKRYDIAYYKDGFEKSNLVTRDQIVNAGTYYVAVIGVPSKGTYAKSSVNNSCTYTINPRSIAPSYILVSGYDGTYYYTGQQIQPKGIAVEDTDLPVTSDANDPQRRTVKLINGTDYDLSYTNNVAAGKASIIVTGKGNYTGNRVAYFNILSSDTDGNNTWDGTSEGTGSISDGTTTIAASDIILGYDNSAYNCMMYNGYERIPTVTINGISTNEFIITASNNIRPGVATLTITGRGNNFTGTIIKNYKIKANLATYGNIAAIADQVYTGYQITPHVTLTCGGNLLNQGSDYTVTYLNNTNVGRATVMANAANDSYYIGTATDSFNISNTAGGMEITGYGYSYTYTGYPIAPDIVVTMNGRVLNRGTDYTVTYSNNTNVGTATMTVTGIGSFSGTKTINYTIEAKNIENCLTTAVTNYQYTGNTYTPNVTVTDSSNGKTLVAGTDYTITYSNNTNPGTASITVTALSKNYTGSKVIPFKITSAAVSGLRTSTIKNNSIKLAWTAQDYADGYQICNSNNRVVATTSKNSYTVKGLTSCTTYKFKVRSYVENADGSVSYGNFSTAVSAKTRLNTPTLKAKSTSKGKVTLTWTKVAKATGYEIYYSTKKDGIYTRLKTISKSSSRKYVDSGLASGEKYYYTIRAYRTSNGVKTYSNYNTIKSVKVK